MGQPARKRDVVVNLHPARHRARMRGHRVGVIVSLDDQGATVDFPGNPHGALRARQTVSIDRALLAGAASREVLLVFEEERSDRPIIVGVLEGATPIDAAPAVGSASPKPARIEMLVDGPRVVLDAQDEIVLRCGEASITLRRNGRVVIRGAYVETRSRGVNRVKGGSVQIN
jgi:hypothetical protein